MNDAAITPLRLDLQKDRQLTIEWQDGHRSVYPISLLRAKCPCAACKLERQAQAESKAKFSLRVLSSNYTGPTTVVSAELVGNYALRLEWSDKHSSGIYSFDYLRGIDPESPVPA
jgi:DUF971 family protein